MTDAPYVFLGWGLTAAIVGGYTLRLLARVRRAARAFPDEEQPWRPR